MRLRSMMVVCVAGLFLVSLPVYADITNGGFETGDFSGWNISGIYTCVATTLCGGNADDTDPGPQAGSYAAYLGSPGNLNGQGQADDQLSQTVVTTAGQNYTLDFFLAVGSTSAYGGALPNSFAVSWDGSTLAALNDLPSQSYKEYSYSVTGTGSDTLLFDTAMYPSVFVLDSISLTEVSASTTEPTSVVLLLTMLSAVAFGARKRIARGL